MSVLSVSDLVEQHVHARPGATAVTFPSDAGGEVSLTYRELSSAANCLAAHLRARGVGHGDRVVTALRQGPDMVIALLAVVRTGAAYVPVDPAAPAEHRRLIVLDSTARAVLTQGAGQSAYQGLDTVVVDLDAEADEIAARPDTLPEPTAGPDDACYVRYASGSTDTSQGVVVPHRAVLDFARSDDYLRLAPSDVVAQATGDAFDAVTFEVWTTLAAGARLVGLARETVVDADRFQEAVRAHGISVIFLTAALYNLIARQRPAALAPLRAVLFGGEACDPHAQTTAWKEIHEASYDGLPIPAEQLPEGQGATLERIRELPRRRVLEIGVGTGLLLGHLAHDPECEEYWGTDLCEQDIATLTARTQADPALADKVRLHCQSAEDTTGLPAHHFDAIVVNSVSRDFPSLAHLRTVIERALPLLAPGGALLLGDLRNLDLARCFRAGPELLLSPALFDALARELPAVRAVDVRAKRGMHHTELTRYRYEAVLHTAEPVADLSGAPVLHWGQDVSSAAGATALLDAVRPAALRLSAVPNLRVHDEFTALQDLEGAAPHHEPAPDPEELCAAGECLGYLALPTWSGQGAELLDIVYVDPDQVPAGPLTGVYAGPAAGVEIYANTPYAVDRTVELEKADRKALPPAPFTAERAGTQPGTPIQEIVRDLFAEVLDVPRGRVHADSDFFGIGGDAPAAARLLSRVRATLGTDPGSRALHEAPTPAAFAALVGDGPIAAAGPVRAGTDSAVLPLRLRGTLNRRALEEALVDLGNRHEALRNSRIGSAGTRLRTLSADDHLLDLALPATSVDLWSHLPLAAELARAYGARATGDTPHRSPAGLDAAPRALFGDTSPTTLPGDAASSPYASYGTVEVDLDEQLHTRLAEFAAAQGATVFMVAHAALAALLTRLGTADDTDGRVTVAAQVPARDSAGLRGAVGPYGRTLALSVDTSGELTFAELLRRVHTTDLAAYRDGASALALPGGVALAVLQELEGRFEAAGLIVRLEHPQLPLPDADLGLVLTERQTPAGGCAGIRLCTAYRYETVGEAAAAELAEQFIAVLEAALDDPQLTIGRLCPLPGSPDEGGSWAGADAALPVDDVATLFAAQVARAPQAAAVSGMTYGELDARADLLAHALIGHRAGPGTSVLTALSSPTAFAVAALAVAKTGAALLPVDPSLDLPENLRPAVLLLDELSDLLLADVPGAARLVRDDADLPPAAGPWPVTDADRTRPLTVNAPVLLVPTDDGTVVVGATSVAATLARPADTAWLVQGYPDGDTALGLLGTLVSGAQVHVPDGSLTKAVPHEVLGWLRQKKARTVLGGADETLCALLALARSEGVELAVSGGWAEGRLVVEQTGPGPARPAPGYRAYVLDAELRPVNPGEVGALYIAGAGVAQGYAGAPAATGERFLPDPFAPADATARMWRTGHAARLDARGALKVLDHAADDDPFADEFATFVVLADAEGHHALWPAAVAAPEGWHETHSEDRYEPCLDHINAQLSDFL